MVTISKISQFNNVYQGWEGGCGGNLLGPCRQRKHGVLERGAVHIVRAAAHVDDAKSDFDSYDEENEIVVSYGYLKAQARGGAIVALEGSEVASEGFLPWQEAPLSLNKKVKKHETMKELMPLGLSREFIIQKGGNVLEGEHDVVVSARMMDSDLLWSRMEQIFDNCTYEKETFSVVVKGVNKGGLTAVLAGYPIFIPISQLQRRQDGEMWDMKSLQEHYLRKRIKIALFEIDSKQRRVVCSELKAIENDIIRKLEVGHVITGKVRKIEAFGAFVGIEGTRVSALLHISNISNRHVTAAEDILHRGEEIKAVIIGMDEDYSNISLSTSVLESREGEIMEDKEAVWANAEENAETFKNQMLEELDR